MLFLVKVVGHMRFMIVMHENAQNQKPANHQTFLILKVNSEYLYLFHYFFKFDFKRINAQQYIIFEWFMKQCIQYYRQFDLAVKMIIQQNFSMTKSPFSVKVVQLYNFNMGYTFYYFFNLPFSDLFHILQAYFVIFYFQSRDKITGLSYLFTIQRNCTKKVLINIKTLMCNFRVIFKSNICTRLLSQNRTSHLL